MNRWKYTALIGVGLGVLALCCGGWVHRRQAEVEAAQSKLSTLRGEVTMLQREAETRDDLRLQLEGLNAAFASYVQILPTPELATEEEMLRRINVLCDLTDTRLLQWRRIKNPRKRTRKGRAAFEEVRLVLSLEAKMLSFMRLLNYVERLPKLFRTNGFSLHSPDPLSYDGEIPALRATLEVSTFRYQG